MSDLPTQGLYQQMHAHPVSGQHLEVLGKQASSKYCAGEASTLTAAVIETVKHAGLSPEQVKRVVEYANTEAYLHDFRKEANDHKYISFQGGPADPGDVLRSLNDGSGSTVFNRSSSDYDTPPGEKTASAGVEEALFSEFSRAEAPMRQANPFGEVMDLRDKLAGAFGVLGSEIDTLEIQYADDADRLYQGVKQAALEGVPLGHVLQAWADVTPGPEYVKVAFQLLTPRLVRDGVFPTAEKIASSLEKTAGAVVVNHEHPLIGDFSSYCATLQKLAEQRATREEVRVHLANVTDFLKKEAAGGFIPKAVGATLRGAEALGSKAAPFADMLVEGAGAPVGTAIKYAPHVAALVAANEARLRLQNNPAYHTAMGVVPGTSEYNYKKQMLQQGY